MDTPQPPGLGRHRLVTFDSLDGSHLGLATSLLRAEVDGDAEVRSVIAATVTPEETFESCLELLLLQAAICAEATADRPFDGGSRYLLDRAKQEQGDLSLLLCQVGMTLHQNPATQRLCVTPVSAFALFDLCLSIARHVETAFNIPMSDLIRFTTNALVTLHPVGC